MMTTSVDLEFYQSRLGRRTHDILSAHLENLWPAPFAGHTAALGLASSLFRSGEGISTCRTSSEKGPFSFLVDSQNIRIPDAAFDRVAVLHGAKTSLDVDFLLRETWRVLKGEGRLLLILPRQHGAWSRYPYTPFGLEPAFTAYQIRKYLDYQGFMVERLDHALFAPPRDSWNDGLVCTVEKIASCFNLGGGVFLVDARKRVTARIGAKEKRCRNHSMFPLPLPI